MAKKFYLSLIIVAALMTVACGSPAKSTTKTPTEPLDPQGNWLFTFTGTDGTPALEFAGQLFELTEPIVTSNEMGSAPFGFGCGGVTAAGQASGTNTINLTITEEEITGDPTFSLTGTIADSQAAMSGNWSAANANEACTADGATAGTWSAQLLTAVTGTWTGSASDGAGLTAVVTENVDQTSVNMGQVTGTLTLSSSACFTGPLTVTGTHLGESLTLNSNPDPDGAVFAAHATVTPTATSATGSATITGGPCDGQTTSFSLTPQS
jgi:hypothetical protein